MGNPLLNVESQVGVFVDEGAVGRPCQRRGGRRAFQRGVVAFGGWVLVALVLLLSDLVDKADAARRGGLVVPEAA